MGRRRGQRTGYLYRKGPSWILRWREDAIAADGTLRRIQCARVIAPAIGPHKLSRREAQRIAWEDILSKLDTVGLVPRSLATIDEFVNRYFLPQWVWSLKPAGKAHYKTQLRRVKAVLGVKRLRDVQPGDVQREVCRMVDSGLSVQTAVHFRNCVSAIFRHASSIGHYRGENPAAVVRMPRMKRKPTHALTIDQARALLKVVPSPVKEMAMLSMTCSLNVAELVGLRWKFVNTSLETRVEEGISLPGRSAAVIENNYRGQVDSTKTPQRCRVVPIPDEVAEVLEDLRNRSRYPGGDDVVFVSGTGTAVDEGNLRNRILAPAGRQIGLTWSLGWHALRHTCGTLAEEVKMQLSDRQALLGHASGKMTLHYTHSDTERRRASVQSIATLISGVKE